MIPEPQGRLDPQHTLPLNMAHAATVGRSRDAERSKRRCCALAVRTAASRRSVRSGGEARRVVVDSY